MDADRELLEKAAKAAGIEVGDESAGGGLFVRAPSQGSVPMWHVWNPLKDDGDALRLAMTVGLSIDFWTETGATVTYDGGAQMSQLDEAGPDPLAAARRAIVRAAAEKSS